MSEHDQSEWSQFLKLARDYIESESAGAVVDYLPPEELSQKLDLELPEEGSSLSTRREFLSDYLKYSVKTGHPMFFNQLWSGTDVTSSLTEFITALSNTSMYTYEVAPVATLLEQKMISELCALFGFSTGEGLFVTGGSNANLQGLMVARQHADQSSKFEGVASDKKYRIFASAESHYSIKKSANILGLGMNSIIPVEVGEDGAMSAPALLRQLEESRARGETPMAVVATAGTTVRGVYEDLETLGAVARDFGVWFHVDGAFGAAAIFSESHRSRLRGIEKADSIAWDPHKMLGLPLICSVVLLREKGGLHRTNSTSTEDEAYIFHQNPEWTWDLGPQSLQCGRKVEVLKLWMRWLKEGRVGFAQHVDRLAELTEYAAEKMRDFTELESMHPPQLATLCFRYRHERADEFNRQLRDTLLKRGLVAVNYGFIGKELTLRLVVTNPNLKESDIDHFFQCLVSTAKELEASNG